jgi:hypothetical protein
MATILRYTVNSSSRTKLNGESSAPGNYGVRNEGPYPVALQYKNDADTNPVSTNSGPSSVLILSPGERIYIHLEDGTGAADDLCATCTVDSVTSTVRVWSAF